MIKSEAILHCILARLNSLPVRVFETQITRTIEYPDSDAIEVKFMYKDKPISFALIYSGSKTFDRLPEDAVYRIDYYIRMKEGSV